MWASWEKVCEPREAGGLGVINIKFFNIALLGKWIWRLGYSKGGLWKEVVDSKYGGWRNLKGPRSNKIGSLWWRELKVIWSMKEWGEKFDDRFRWKVGNRKEIRFWEDKWVGNLELKNKFPRLFSLCGDKDLLLECCGVWEEGDWSWKLGWRRNLFEWEKP